MTNLASLTTAIDDAPIDLPVRIRATVRREAHHILADSGALTQVIAWMPEIDRTNIAYIAREVIETAANRLRDDLTAFTR